MFDAKDFRFDLQSHGFKKFINPIKNYIIENQALVLLC